MAAARSNLALTAAALEPPTRRPACGHPRCLPSRCRMGGSRLCRYSRPRAASYACRGEGQQGVPIGDLAPQRDPTAWLASDCWCPAAPAPWPCAAATSARRPQRGRWLPGAARRRVSPGCTALQVGLARQRILLSLSWLKRKQPLATSRKILNDFAVMPVCRHVLQCAARGLQGALLGKQRPIPQQPTTDNRAQGTRCGGAAALACEDAGRHDAQAQERNNVWMAYTCHHLALLRSIGRGYGDQWADHGGGCGLRASTQGQQLRRKPRQPLIAGLPGRPRTSSSWRMVGAGSSKPLYCSCPSAGGTHGVAGRVPGQMGIAGRSSPHAGRQAAAGTKVLREVAWPGCTR